MRGVGLWSWLVYLAHDSVIGFRGTYLAYGVVSCTRVLVLSRGATPRSRDRARFHDAGLCYCPLYRLPGPVVWGGHESHMRAPVSCLGGVVPTRVYGAGGRSASLSRGRGLRNSSLSLSSVHGLFAWVSSMSQSSETVPRFSSVPLRSVAVVRP